MKRIMLILFFLFSCFFCFDKVDAAIISDGVYKINSALATNKVLDVKDANTNNKTNIQLYDYNDTNAQKWYVKHLGNDCYEITSLLNRNKSLDVKDASKKSGANVQLYDANGTAAQKWYIKYSGDGYYNIVSKANNLYVDVNSGKTLNGTNIQMYKGNDTKAQKFKFIEVLDGKQTINDGTYTISSALNGAKAIDVSGGNPYNKSNVQLYDLNDTWAQIWKVKYLNNGYYLLTTYLDESKSLDVENASSVNGANVQIYSANGTNAQQWVIKDAGNGYYNIISKIDHLYVDINSAKTLNGTNIQLYHGNGTAAQKFKFNKIDVKVLNDGLYSISSLLSSDKLVSVNGQVGANGVNVQLEQNTENNSQKWYVKSIGNGYYSITSSLVGNRALDVAAAGKVNGTNVQIYDSNGTSAQKWYIKYASDDSYYIITKNDFKYLDVANGAADDGTNIQIFEGNGTNAQKFKFIETTINETQRTYDDGYYTIGSALDKNKLVEVSSGKKINGTNVQLYEKNNTPAQIWYLKYLDNGYYSITSAMNPNVGLDVQDYGTSNGTNVQIYKYKKSDNQQWYLKDLGNGRVSIISKSSGLYMESKMSGSLNGTNIQVSSKNNSDSQIFYLNKYTDKKTFTGIDVSYHQGDINWEKVANSDLGFVIIRAGYGGDWTKQDDAKFIANVAACEKYNIPYGVYLYSYAREINSNDNKGAFDEAKHMLRLIDMIKVSNYSPSLGTKVFLDVEDKSVSDVPYDKLTGIVDAFCSTIESNGYECGIYANKNWLTNMFNTVSLAKKYDIWLAEWLTGYSDYNFRIAKNSKPTYSLTPYKFWQFTNSGNIGGINTRVDLNLGYDIFE